MFDTKVDTLRDVPITDNLVDKDSNSTRCDIGNDTGSPTKVRTSNLLPSTGIHNKYHRKGNPEPRE